MDKFKKDMDKMKALMHSYKAMSKGKLRNTELDKA